MKIKRIINTLCLIVVFWSAQTKSDPNLTPYYGIVNEIYADESRIIIGDTSLHYEKNTPFYNTYGRIIVDIKKSLKSGTPVKFRFYKNTSKRVLEEVKIVTQKELNRFQRKTENY